MLLTLKKLIYPHKCIVCSTILTSCEEGYICPKCDKGILRDNVCPKCSKPYYIEGESCIYCKELASSIDKVIALFPYQKTYKQSVLRWKYKGIRKYGKGFAEILADEKLEIKELDINALIPVPISTRRYRERGFNQAHDLACELGIRLELPVYDILSRKRNTKPQSACTKEERRKNIREFLILLTI